MSAVKSTTESTRESARALRRRGSSLISSASTSIGFSKHSTSVEETSGASRPAGVSTAEGVSSSSSRSVDRSSTSGGGAGDALRGSNSVRQRVKNAGRDLGGSLKDTVPPAIEKPTERPTRRGSSVSYADPVPGVGLLGGENDDKSGDNNDVDRQGVKRVSWGEKTEDVEVSKRADERDFLPSYGGATYDAVVPPPRPQVGDGDAGNENELLQQGEAGASAISRDAAASTRIASLRSKIPLSKIKIVVGEFYVSLGVFVCEDSQCSYRCAQISECIAGPAVDMA